MKSKKICATIALIIVLVIIGYMVYGYYQKRTFELTNPVVTMEIEDYGTVRMELYPEMAPNTVRNFIKLINEGYYNGLNFHRVEDTLIQGGSVNGDGTGETEYTISGEFSSNGYKENTLSFEAGTLGLARTDYSMYYQLTGDASYLTAGYDSGCAQFFITTADCSDAYDGNYCAFGKVLEGLEIVEEISKLKTVVETDEESGEKTETTTPVNPPIIKSMTVDTFGIEYKEPETIKTGE